MIKVLIVDDQKLLSEGLKSVLETSDEIEVPAIASDGEEAIALVGKYLPDVVLMDVRMPKMNGVAATKEIKRLFPGVKVIILTTFDDSDYILDAINYGASGYLLKDINAKALIDAVKNAVAGDTILPARIAKKITDAAKMVSADKEIKLKKAYNLSDREVEIALMLYDDFNNRQIASALNISEGTCRNYISSIYLKLSTLNRTTAKLLMDELFKK